MHKYAIGALAALTLAAAPTWARADAQADEPMTDLASAASALTGSGVDVGWDAMTPQSTELRGKPDMIDMTFTPFARHEDVGDLKHDRGNVEADRYGFDLRMDYTDDCGNLWAFRWGWEETSRDISSEPVGATSDEQLDDTSAWSVSLQHQRRICDRWSAFGGVGFQFAGVSGANVQDGGNFMGSLGGIYKIDERFTVGLGALVVDDFDDSVNVLPLPLLTYRINDRTAVRVRGPRADILRRVDDRITVRGMVAWESRSYRLDRGTAGAPDGSVNDEHLLVGGGVDFAATEWLTVRGELGVLFAQNFEVENDRGSRLGTLRSDDTGFFLGLSAIFVF